MVLKTRTAGSSARVILSIATPASSPRPKWGLSLVTVSSLTSSPRVIPATKILEVAPNWSHFFLYIFYFIYINFSNSLILSLISAACSNSILLANSSISLVSLFIVSLISSSFSSLYSTPISSA